MKTEGNIYLKINVYVIREIYKSLGKAKLHTSFVHPAKRTSFTNIAHIFGIDKQRFNRILTERGSHKINKDEAERLSQKFNIAEEYFLNRSDFVLNGPISVDAWASFFQYKYAGLRGYFISSFLSRSSFDKLNKEIEEYIEKSIKNCEQGNINGIEEIFRIYWYFTTCTTYVDDIESKVQRNIQELKAVTSSEWKEMNDNTIDDTIRDLKELQEKLVTLQNCKKFGFIK